MSYTYETAILSISPPQRGLKTMELPSVPPISTPDGRELILSKRFLQWLHADNITTTLYTSSLRLQESDIVIKNIAGLETPFVLLPYGMPPPPADMTADPLLTVVSLSVRRALVPAVAPTPPPTQPALQPPHAPQTAWAPSVFQTYPRQHFNSNTWVMPPPPYAYAPPPYPPSPAHAPPHAPAPGQALTSTAANIAKNRGCRSARQSLPYRPQPSLFDVFDPIVKHYMHIMGHEKRGGSEFTRPYVTEYDVMKVRARRAMEAVSSLPWALAAAGVGLALAMVL